MMNNLAAFSRKLKNTGGREISGTWNIRVNSPHFGRLLCTATWIFLNMC